MPDLVVVGGAAAGAGEKAGIGRLIPVEKNHARGILDCFRSNRHFRIIVVNLRHDAVVHVRPVAAVTAAENGAIGIRTGGHRLGFERFRPESGRHFTGHNGVEVFFQRRLIYYNQSSIMIGNFQNTAICRVPAGPAVSSQVFDDHGTVMLGVNKDAMLKFNAVQPLRGNFNQFPGRFNQHALARFKGEESAAAFIFEGIVMLAVQADLPVKKRLLGKLVQVLPEQHPDCPRQVRSFLQLGRRDFSS